MASMAASMPLYRTIADDLKGMISSGKLLPGQIIYSENQLAQQYQTSRMTVRKSLSLLEDEGYVYPEQGKGYFVNKPAHDDFTLVFSDDESTAGSAGKYQTHLHYVHIITPDAELCAELGYNRPRPTISLCRLVADGEKNLAVDYKYLPYRKGEATLEGEINYALFPEIAAARTAPFAFHTRMEIGVQLASGEVLELLGCGDATPLLVVRRYFLSSSEQVIGFGIKYQLEEYGRMIATSGYEVNDKT